jgi:hypothetical protein
VRFTGYQFSRKEYNHMMNTLFTDYKKITWEDVKQATDMIGIINMFYFVFEAW